jgi:hypothetical protein
MVCHRGVVLAQRVVQAEGEFSFFFCKDGLGLPQAKDILPTIFND